MIGWTAVGRLMAPTPMVLADETRGILVMVVSIVLTLGLVWWQGRVARATGSRVVAADRLHYLGDLMPSLGAIAALWASSAFGLSSVDAVVALAAAGGDGGGRAAHRPWRLERADGPPGGPEIIEGIAAIARDWPGVHGFHDLKTRTAGRRVFVNLHIELDGDQSLREAHAIGAALRGRSWRAIRRPT